jgi:hypothetical protein
MPMHMLMHGGSAEVHVLSRLLMMMEMGMGMGYLMVIHVHVTVMDVE